jgi:serine/threonine-protein kinase ATR
MLAPFLRTIALVIGSSALGKNTILPEVCRLVSISKADFWMRAHALCLPHFVSTRNKEALDMIAKEMSTSVSHLLLQCTDAILAHIFLLQDTSSTDRALFFFVGVLRSAAPHTERSSIDLVVVTKSCLVPLLANLVIALGSEDRSSQCRVRSTCVHLHYLIQCTGKCCAHESQPGSE